MYFCCALERSAAFAMQHCSSQPMNHQHTVNVAIFASGSGSNAEALIQYSQRNDASYSVVVVVSNKENAGVRAIAERYSIPFEHVKQPDDGASIIALLQKYDVDIIALGGYMKLLPSALVRSFKGRIINIHPSLLPDYGGKGMYGKHVHMAVWKDKLPYTGLTIHHVDEEYDRGQALVQARIDIGDCSSPEAIGEKVKEAEHIIYPLMLNQLCKIIYSQR